ncbi:MAG: phytanoyl-CoA dioxygenase family protein, partial [Chloroflexi bacterium]|nr:phytanoyl-CoA dioxygenase family protein [Chloroflexota bacterium]
MSVSAVKPDVDEVVAAIKEDGFALVERLIDADRAAEIRQELSNVLEKTLEGRNDFEGFSTRRIYALFAKTRAFD